MGEDSEMNNEPKDIWTSCLDCGQRVTGDSIHTCSPQLKTLNTFTTEDRMNSSPPHIVNSGASVKTLGDYIEQENREEMLRNQLHLLQDRIKELEMETFKLRRQMEQLLSEKW